MSIIVTFHDEGPLAKMTMNSLARCLARLDQGGVKGEVVCVLDQADERTTQIVRDAAMAGGCAWRVNLSSAGDLGAARNFGISMAAYDQILITDGDDYYSENLAYNSFIMSENDDAILVHPEFVVNFGITNDFTQQFGQESYLFNEDGLLTDNFWTSCVSASKAIFTKVPYTLKSNGFGFEDWGWNCMAIKLGFRHVVAPGTAMFYRRKPLGMMGRETGARRIAAPHGLFKGDKR